METPTANVTTLMREFQERITALEKEVASLRLELTQRGSLSHRADPNAIYLVVSNYTKGALASMELVYAIQALLPNRTILTAQQEDLLPGADVFVIVLPSTQGYPTAAGVTKDLEMISRATGNVPNILMGIVMPSQIYGGISLFQKWSSLNDINKELYKQTAIYFRRELHNDFVKWRSGDARTIKSMGGIEPSSLPKRTQAPSMMSFDGTSANFKLGRKF